MSRIAVRGRQAALAALLVAFAAAGWAQLAPSPDESPVSNAPAQPVDETPVATLKVQVNLVDLFFTVKDKHGNLVPHLTRGECSVTEDGAPQTLTSFVAETRQPLTLGILVDASGSQKYVLGLEQQVGAQFLDRVLRPKDMAFLLSFDVNVDLMQDFTNNVRLLTRALNKVEINSGVSFGASPVPTPGGPRGTVLFDAVYLAANEKMHAETGRKAMILLTDGQDEGSRKKIADAIEAAQKANVIVYTILLADRDAYGILGYSGHSAMKRMTEETGGRLIDVGNNSKKLEAAFQQIEDELRTQYLVTYKPINQRLDGGFRKVAVDCHGDGLKVLVRKGYYAAAADSQ